jgi:secreted protein with Ig-like and vWFA domain
VVDAGHNDEFDVDVKVNNDYGSDDDENNDDHGDNDDNDNDKSINDLDLVLLTGLLEIGLEEGSDDDNEGKIDDDLVPKNRDFLICFLDLTVHY